MFKRNKQTVDSSQPTEWYRIVRHWDVGAAEEVYALEGYTLLSMSVHFPDLWGWHLLATGDLDWAKRTAAHYKIEVPKLSKEEKQ